MKAYALAHRVKAAENEIIRNVHEAVEDALKSLVTETGLVVHDLRITLVNSRTIEDVSPRYHVGCVELTCALPEVYDYVLEDPSHNVEGSSVNSAGTG